MQRYMLDPLRDSALKAKPLGSVVFQFFVAPEHLREHLEQEDCLFVVPCRASRPPLNTSIGAKPTGTASMSGFPVAISVKCRFSPNQVSAVHRQALAGTGIAFLPLVSCAKGVRAGALLPVLPGRCSDPARPCQPGFPAAKVAHRSSSARGP
ncbi:MAG TPA: hypothetical protein VMK12_17520 [Anaeromyxobacteraceae bacterium]|nr:hypothetical protein [Anaeromyxobacteraceae bacterium]